MNTQAKSYAFRRQLNLPFAESLRKTREALKEEGFGVLCEIDMKEKLREKLRRALDNL